jgi:hypothetical protein
MAFTKDEVQYPSYFMFETALADCLSAERYKTERLERPLVHLVCFTPE